MVRWRENPAGSDTDPDLRPLWELQMTNARARPKRHAAKSRPDGTGTPAPLSAITPTGPWGLAARAGDFIYVAGMRGIDPATDLLVQGAEARIRQAFLNMKLIAESKGATLGDCVRLVVYTTDMARFRPLANKVQEELWGVGPYPPRTIVEVRHLNQGDILEVEGTFFAPVRRRRRTIAPSHGHNPGRASSELAAGKHGHRRKRARSLGDKG